MASLGNKLVNWGGLTLLVKDIKLSSSTYGANPTSLSGTEIAALDGVTAGTVTASKALVVDSNKDLATLRDISGRNVTLTGNVAGGYTRPVVEDGAAVVLTAAQSGALCIFDKVDGAQFTLPAPVVGLWYEFINVASVTSGSHKVITDAGTTFIIGSVDMVDTDTTFTHTNQDANGSTHVSVLMAAASTNSTGGIKGTRFKLVCRTATTWAIEGQINHAGTVASPFSTS